MQEQIGDENSAGRRGFKPIERIRNDGIDLPFECVERRDRFNRRARLQVQQGRRDRAGAQSAPGCACRCRESVGGSAEPLRHSEEKRSVARAEVGDMGRLAAGHRWLKRVSHDFVIAHHGVDTTQIAAGPDCARIVRRKPVEKLGLNIAVHLEVTSSSAPWQLNPAPNDDIHQRPSGVLPERARSRTNKTVGLLMFPKSRSTAAL